MHWYSFLHVAADIESLFMSVRAQIILLLWMGLTDSLCLCVQAASNVFVVFSSQSVTQMCVVVGSDWDFSARLPECQHIGMLHSIKALQG